MKHDVALADTLGLLARRYELPESVVARFSRLLGMIEAEPASITSVRDPQVAVWRHVDDALAGLCLSEMRTATRLADLGAGAGLPGLVLAIALPDTCVTLVESVERKCRFQRLAAAACGCDNVRVLHSRAESWREGRSTQDLVTARALAPLAVLVEYAAPLLIEGGSLVAWKGAVAKDEAEAGARAAAVVGLKSVEPVLLPPFPNGGGGRTLQRYLKVMPTPERFPRRAGMARKRPLAA